jgi:hypothetical protein
VVTATKPPSRITIDERRAKHFDAHVGHPEGLLGKLGGIIMARMNADCGSWVSDLLEIRPNDSVLEVGFGPGVVIQRLPHIIPPI